MQTQSISDVHFEAMKDVTRLAWLLNFEALATVPSKRGAIPGARPVIRSPRDR